MCAQTTSKPCFQIQFERSGSLFRVTWQSPQFGPFETMIDRPFFHNELQAIYAALSAVQGRTALPSEFMARYRELELPLQGEQPAANLPLVVGQRLFAHLAANPIGAAFFLRYRSHQQRSGASPDLELHFGNGTEVLYGLPWESLSADGKWPLLLAAAQPGGLTRLVGPATRNPQPGQPLEIVVCLPRPHDRVFCPDKRFASLTALWAPLVATGQARIHRVASASRSELFDLLQTIRPDLLHITTHGAVLDGRGVLEFNDQHGRPDLVPVQQIGGMLGNARVVMLESCYGGRCGAGNMDGTAARSCLMGADAVVAMQASVGVAAAFRFSEVFYRALVRGESLRHAVALGRWALFTENLPLGEWYLPTLTARVGGDGTLATPLAR